MRLRGSCVVLEEVKGDDGTVYSEEITTLHPGQLIGEIALIHGTDVVSPTTGITLRFFFERQITFVNLL
jgi:hypothetical protein